MSRRALVGAGLPLLALSIYLSIWAICRSSGHCISMFWQGESADEPMTTSLVLTKSDFNGIEPINVDVYLENPSRRTLIHRQFSPISSSVGLPYFEFVDLVSGEEFSLCPGLFAESDEWCRWYQPGPYDSKYGVGEFKMPARSKVHLLSGDLRKMISDAKTHCSMYLIEPVWAGPDHAETMNEYRKIVAFAEKFERGRAYEIRVWADAVSNAVRINVLPANAADR